MKKLLSILTALAVATMSLTAVAADEQVSSPAMSPKHLSGRITNEKENSIEVHSEINDESVILNISEETYVIDAVSGEPTDLKNRVNDDVSVYYGPVETRSLPPQSNAVAIICNIPQDYSPLHYTLVEEVKKSGDEIKVTTNDGSLIIRITGETPISAYRSGSDVTLDDIEEGSELLVWYAMVAMSYPGQTTATKTVILEKSSTDAEVTMVPLRAAAEAKGYTVKWENDAKAIMVSKGDEAYILTIGNNLYGDVQLEAAPELRDSTTYVPNSFFTDVLKVDIK